MLHPYVALLDMDVGTATSASAAHGILSIVRHWYAGDMNSRVLLRLFPNVMKIENSRTQSAAVSAQNM